MSKATLVESEHLLELAGVADHEDRRGRPFKVTHARVFAFPAKSRVTWVSLTGPAIRVDGTVGRATRYRPYDLAGPKPQDPAPEWLRELLQGAGVRW